MTESQELDEARPYQNAGAQSDEPHMHLGLAEHLGSGSRGVEMTFESFEVDVVPKPDPHSALKLYARGRVLCLGHGGKGARG